MKAKIILSLVLAVVLFGCTKVEDTNGVTPIGVPELAKPMVDEIKYTKATICSEVCFDQGMLYSVRERGFEWSTDPDFSNKDKYKFDAISFNEGFGQFKYDLFDLENGTTYYVRAYAISNTNKYATMENIGYSEVTTFTTVVGTVPTVKTVDVKNVYFTTANVFGEVVNSNTEPVFERGFVWDTEANPTYKFNLGRSVEAGELGKFETLIQGLEYNTTYYVRAYAKSEAGIGYGEEKSFTTTEPKSYIVNVNGVDLPMTLVEGGTFRMGNTKGGGEMLYDERPVHEVTLDSYCIGQTEVTQELWVAVMGKNPSRIIGDKMPVDNVSWDDCQEFLKKIYDITGITFRLPTEAEWEYAAKGGNKSAGHNYSYAGSDDPYSVAWFYRNSNGVTHDVATKAANELGLYDMSGNVWEWCNNWEYQYNGQPQNNPMGPETGLKKAVRGGAYDYDGLESRVSNRYFLEPNTKTSSIGLRLVQY